MNIQTKATLISHEEIARRRRIVEEANWSVRMEGLGEQDAEYNALSELWITGKITRDELELRRSERSKR